MVRDMYEHEDLEMIYLNHYSLHLPRENLLCGTDEDWDESFERNEDDSGNKPNQTKLFIYFLAYCGNPFERL